MKYKFLRSGLKSQSGDIQWKIGQWVHLDGVLDMCGSGLNSKKNRLDTYAGYNGSYDVSNVLFYGSYKDVYATTNAACSASYAGYNGPYCQCHF